MDGVMIKRFGTCKEIEDGIYPTFGFAVADYIAKYHKTAEESEQLYIFGAILYTYDITPYTFRLIKNIMKNDKSLALIVLDITDEDGNMTLTVDDVKMIYDELDGAFGFEEMKCVYENRIVFARG